MTRTSVRSFMSHLTNDAKRLHPTNLKREHLIDQVCIQEICHPKKSKKCCPRTVAFPQLSPQKSQHRAKKQHKSDKNQFRLKVSGTPAEAFGFRSMCGSGLVGIPMKNAIAAHLPDEHFVIRVDGRVKSHHRRFLDALREGLQLRDQFPQHDVKVQSMQADDQQRTALH
jgi:hypothetical protein